MRARRDHRARSRELGAAAGILLGRAGGFSVTFTIRRNDRAKLPKPWGEPALSPTVAVDYGAGKVAILESAALVAIRAK